MPYYEVIYETGNYSVAFYDSDEEAISALSAHHTRAKEGESATPASTPRSDLGPADMAAIPGRQEWPAERIKRVLVYEQHPANFGQGNLTDADSLNAAIKEATTPDGIEVGKVAAGVRASASPVVVDKTSRHDTNYKMKEARELEGGWE